MGAYLQLQNITKGFPGVQALKDVSVDINTGEIHVIIGENGAGKSTLMKIVAGLYRQDSGKIILDGKEVQFSSPIDAIENHVSMIHQELMPEPYLSVAENVFLGREPLNRLGLLNKKKLIIQTKELFEEIGIDIDPQMEMQRLSMAQKQLVEIAKAVSFRSKVLIMDEPTSAISDREVDRLYDLIFKLKKDGVAIIFISHKLDEIFRVADRVTVLRDGEFIATRNASELNKDTLIAMMVGRDITNIFDKQDIPIGPPVLEVRNLSKAGLFKDISFTLHKSEILGIAGLMGAGRTELVETIFGLRKADTGEIYVDGKKVSIRHPSDAQAVGIALVPEDRKGSGLNLKDTTGFNISLCDLKEFIKLGVLQKKQEAIRVDGMIEEMNVKVTSRHTAVSSLSGGNQQKVVVAKWIMCNADIVIMDEPTRGIDIGAKSEIYRLITRLVQEGKSVIMVSSELPEIIGMSDRVLVLCEGKLTGELVGDQINQQDIMRCATNQNEELKGG